GGRRSRLSPVTHARIPAGSAAALCTITSPHHHSLDRPVGRHHDTRPRWRVATEGGRLRCLSWPGSAIRERPTGGRRRPSGRSVMVPLEPPLAGTPLTGTRPAVSADGLSAVAAFPRGRPLPARAPRPNPPGPAPAGPAVPRGTPSFQRHP